VIAGSTTSRNQQRRETRRGWSYAGASTAGRRSGAKNPHLELLNASPKGTAVGMVCSHVNVGEPEPMIGEDAVDLVGAEQLLSLATNTPSRWRVGDFLGGEGRGT